jgi:nitroreductase
LGQPTDTLKAREDHRMTELTVFEAIHTARAMRRLKADPVPEELITKVLDAAIRAPSGGNAQTWSFVVVRDAALRRELGRLYREGSDIAAASYAARGKPAHMSQAQFDRMMAAGTHLWDHMGDAPVLLLPCMRPAPAPPYEALPPAMQARYPEELAYMRRIRGASIYPAVQNIILACRALGLGTVLTTNHLRCEAAVKALLAIPDDVDTYGLMPIGWPIGHFGPLTRRPLPEVAFTDRWGAPWPDSPATA